MQYIVMQRIAMERPTFYGPFSSFAQACEWAQVDPVRAHDLETDGLDMPGGVRVTIRAIYRP